MRFADLDLGWRSHLLATGFGGVHTERVDCIVIRMPGNPGFYWGNCIVLPAAPEDAELAHWLARFAEEVPGARHVAIGVNAAYAGQAMPAWREAGFEIDETVALSLEPAGLGAVPETKVRNVHVRPLVLPDEAPPAVDLQCACNDLGFEPEAYRAFRTAMMVRMSALDAQGEGRWFGAFVGGVLAADCGLVHGGELGRFQHVQTHPARRRLGLCRALVHGVCGYAFDTLGLQRLVMCADPHDVAIGIYRSVGFTPVARHWQLQRHAPEDAA